MDTIGRIFPFRFDQRPRSMSPPLLLLLLVLCISTIVIKNAEGQALFVNVTTSNAFVPGLLQITVGETVTWMNQGGSHNVISDDGAFQCAEGCAPSANSALVAVGEFGNGNASSAQWRFNITFLAAGLYSYYCQNYGGPSLSGMSGAIYVVPAPLVALQTGVISGGDFVAILAGVTGGILLGIVLLVVAITAYRKRDALKAPFLRLFATTHHTDS